MERWRWMRLMEVDLKVEEKIGEQRSIVGTSPCAAGAVRWEVPAMPSLCPPITANGRWKFRHATGSEEGFVAQSGRSAERHHRSTAGKTKEKVKGILRLSCTQYTLPYHDTTHYPECIDISSSRGFIPFFTISPSPLLSFHCRHHHQININSYIHIDTKPKHQNTTNSEPPLHHHC